MLLTTSPRGLSELLGGGVPSSDIDHSRPRIRHLLSHILLIEPAPTSLTSVLLPSGGGISLLTRRPIHGHVSTRYHPSNRASPVSISAHQKTFVLLALTRHFQIPIPPPLSHLHPRHACQIPVAAAPLLLPQYLLTRPSDFIQMPTASTTAPRAPPLIAYILCIYLEYSP